MAINKVNRFSVTPRILSTKFVCVLTTLSRPTLWRLEKAGKFPEKIQLSPNRVGYDAIKVENWIAEGGCNISAPVESNLLLIQAKPKVMQNYAAEAKVSHAT
jgi:predicted DNA-binding transcriptional regulator AlpA